MSVVTALVGHTLGAKLPALYTSRPRQGAKMNCLHCGDCCKRMSPLGSPCRFIIEQGSFIFCSVYSKRPVECVNHDFPSRHCPIGCDVLGINDISEIQNRLQSGYYLIKEGAAGSCGSRQFSA